MAATASAARPSAGLRQRAGAFWRWWTGELVQLVPERFAIFGRTEGAPVVTVRDGEAGVTDAKGSIVARAKIGSLDDAGRKAAARSLLEGAGELRGRARALLGSDEALVRRVSMPAATEENLRQVLEFEMDRLTPFKADEVYFDYRVVSRDAAAGQLHLQLAVARREVVDARVRELKDLGINVQGVAIREGAAHAGAPFDLLPSEQRGERESSRERLVQRIAIGVVLLLLFGALVYPVYRKRETFIALNPLVNEARKKAEDTNAIAGELERQVADYNLLLARKHGAPPALALVEELTRLLPDNTWVQQFDVKNVGKVREVQISGETASSSKLIEILEGSTLLQNAAFRGTVTRGQTQGTERFLIAAEVRPRPQPETKSVLEAMSVVPNAPVKLKPAAVPAQAAPTAPSASAPPSASAATASQPAAGPPQPAAPPAPKAGWPKK